MPGWKVGCSILRTDEGGEGSDLFLYGDGLGGGLPALLVNGDA